MKQQRVACRLPGCKEEKLQFCGGRTPVNTSCHLSAKGKSSIAHQVFEMGGVPGWSALASLCRPTTSLRSS